MNNTEFLFWLQGYFEIRMNVDSPLSIIQVPIIRDHIKLVEDENPYSGNFITGLKSIFEIYDNLLGIVEPGPLLEAITKVIKINLEKEFEKKTPIRDRPSLPELPDLSRGIYRPGLDCVPHPFLTPQQITTDKPLPGLAAEVTCADGASIWSSLTGSKIITDANTQLQIPDGTTRPPLTTFGGGDMEYGGNSSDSPVGSC